MKITVLLELLVILIIIAYGAAKPLTGNKNAMFGRMNIFMDFFYCPISEESRGIKLRQAVETPAVVAAAIKPTKPAAADDDDGSYKNKLIDTN